MKPESTSMTSQDYNWRNGERFSSWDEISPGDYLIFAGLNLVVEYESNTSYHMTGTVMYSGSYRYQDVGYRGSNWTVGRFENYSEYGWLKLPGRILQYDPTQQGDTDEDI